MLTDTLLPSNLEADYADAVIAITKGGKYVDTSTPATKWVYSSPIPITKPTTSETVRIVDIQFLTGDLSEKYQITRPIPVVFSIDEDGEFIGDIQELELYAFGSDKSELIDELKDDIIDLLDSLQKESNLGVYPLKWNKILQDTIVEK